MPVTILSPYSGRPVSVREQDLGRALRDEQGRVFYVVEDDDHGRYASRTRKGSTKDLEHYRGLADATAAPSEDSAPTASESGGSATPHDATGVQRRNPVGLALIVLALLALAAAAYVWVARPAWLGLGPNDADANAPQAAPDPPAPDTGQDADPTPRTPGEAVVSHDPDDPSAGDPPDQTTANDPVTSVPAAVSAAPAMLPETPQDYADRLRLAANDDAPADLADDPEPVIVPTRTWRPMPEPAVLSQSNPDRPYAEFRHTASGLRYLITHRTDGPPARAGSYLRVRYTAQSLDGEPLIDDAEQSFVLMSGNAIRAFDEGLAGIREGEQLQLLIPRGHSEHGTLPGIERVPDQPFLMDIQLLEVRPGVTHVVEVKGDIDRAPASPGDTVIVHYVARVEGRDEVIDATARTGQPMRFTLGQTEMIPGLELGLLGVRPGESRLVTIPPYLAYGEQGVAGGLIPPNAVLTFRLTVVDIERPQPDDTEQ